MQLGFVLAPVLVELGFRAVYITGDGFRLYSSDRLPLQMVRLLVSGDTCQTGSDLDRSDEGAFGSEDG